MSPRYRRFTLPGSLERFQLSSRGVMRTETRTSLRIRDWNWLVPVRARGYYRPDRAQSISSKSHHIFMTSVYPQRGAEWNSSIMLEPELVIGYREDGNAASARCSLCGEWMPEDYALDATGQAILTRFIEHFKCHVREKHGTRYVN